MLDVLIEWEDESGELRKRESQLRERVLAGLQRARAQGTKLGRQRNTRLPADAPAGLTVRQAAAL